MYEQVSYIDKNYKRCFKLMQRKQSSFWLQIDNNLPFSKVRVN